MSDLRRLGTEAEDRAADYLMGLGYTVITRRFRAKRGEIDVVALDDETLVFVEVKARFAGGDAEASVGPQKRAAMERAAWEYRQATDQLARAYRYDVVALDREGLRHHVDVFSD